MKLEFVVNEDYLIAHTLAKHDFTSDKDQDTIIALKDTLYSCPKCYKVLGVNRGKYG